MSSRRLPLVLALLFCAVAAIPLSCSKGGMVVDEPGGGDAGLGIDGATPRDGGGADGGADGAGGPTAAWQVSAGLYGGSVQTVVVDPKTPAIMWAGTYGAGIFKSGDGGVTWSATGKGLTWPNVYKLAIDPKKTSTVYAIVVAGRPGFAGNQVFRTQDSGATWTQLTIAVPPVENVYYDIQPHPKAAGIVDILTYEGIYRSSDDGATFAPQYGGIPANSLQRSFAVDPSDAQVLYLLGRYTVYKSIDGGSNWTERNSGLPTGGAGAALEYLAIDPQSPQTLYLSTLNAGSGFFKSTDGALSWLDTGSSPRSYNGGDSLVIDSAGGIYSLYDINGVYKSGDGGKSWSRLSTPYGEGVRSLAVHPTDAKRLFVGWNFQGLMSSRDGGASWAKADTGISNLSVYAAAFAPSQPDTVYVGLEYGGVYKSKDGGKSFTATGGLPVSLAITALVVHPADPQIVYAGASKSRLWYTVGTYPKERLWKSIDGGTTWYALDLGPGTDDAEFSQIAIVPSNPKTLYAIGTQTYRSTTDGVGFTKLPVSGTPATSLVLSPTDAQKLFIYLGNQWRRSDDSGASFVDWKSGMLSGGNEFLNDLPRLGIDPSAPATYYGCHTTGFYKTTNAGTSWTHAAVGFMANDCGLLALSSAAPAIVYALSSKRILHRSSDGATTWRPVAEGLPGNTADFSAIATSPKDAGLVLVATRNSLGLLRSTSGGL